MYPGRRYLWYQVGDRECLVFFIWVRAATLAESSCLPCLTSPARTAVDGDRVINIHQREFLARATVHIICMCDAYLVFVLYFDVRGC